MSKFYSLSAAQKNGQAYNFGDLKGKVVLIVNTASACGFTPQFEGLEKLNKDYKDQGLVVIGFPCNQFGSQDKGSNDEIEQFCKVNYGVSFPIMAKSDVNGDNANEVFKYLKSQKKSLLMERVKWNFEKFLIDRKGTVVNRYASTTSPDSIRSEIERLLKEAGPADAAAPAPAAAPEATTA